ncbi:hypothetical protein BU15DRAFT_65308 [Melanogaster broomeanus]|nr:hypothetical protein BU15DRAFT_65308 [Melanogaster broomeanus]
MSLSAKPTQVSFATAVGIAARSPFSRAKEPILQTFRTKLYCWQFKRIPGSKCLSAVARSLGGPFGWTRIVTAPDDKYPPAHLKAPIEILVGRRATPCDQVDHRQVAAMMPYLASRFHRCKPVEFNPLQESSLPDLPISFVHAPNLSPFVITPYAHVSHSEPELVSIQGLISPPVARGLRGDAVNQFLQSTGPGLEIREIPQYSLTSVTSFRSAFIVLDSIDDDQDLSIPLSKLLHAGDKFQELPSLQ